MNGLQGRERCQNERVPVELADLVQAVLIVTDGAETPPSSGSDPDPHGYCWVATFVCPSDQLSVCLSFCLSLVHPVLAPSRPSSLILAATKFMNIQNLE